jgi:hypothetical protein
MDIMIRIITDTTDPMLDFVRDDPVRPEIPREFRVAANRFVAALVDGEVRAMVCVSLQHAVPTEVDELGDAEPAPTCAVFYTIWSYAAGAGARLLFDTVAEIQQRWPTVTRYVTLSPQTDTAHRFHTRNGAQIYRVNPTTVNYEYAAG